MRILICNWRDIRHPLAGGAEVFVHEIARRWVAAGHAVTQFSAAIPELGAAERVDGVRIVRGGGRYGVYGAARQFYRQNGSGRYDLVIDAVNTRPFGCAAWVHDTPVVALIHQLCREIWFHHLPWPAAALGRYVLEPAWLRAYRDRPVLTVSPSSWDSLIDAGLRDVAVVPVGVTRRPRPNVSREARPTILFVGRMVPSKGPLAALAAFQLLRQRMPSAQLWFVGGGPLEGTLRRLDPPGVRIFGRVAPARRDELMARAHALVMTSVREGWGLVVDEAAAMGTPTIGYDQPGLRDSIPAAGGVLVPPDPHKLAEGLARYLPRWHAAPATTGWMGGAVDWDVVAGMVLARAVQRLDRAAARQTAPV